MRARVLSRLGAVALALVAAAACTRGLDATVHVTGTIRAPEGRRADCRMVYRDARGHRIATRPVSGDFDVELPVARKARTYRFDFLCDGYAEVSTALTLRALPNGQAASLGTISLGPAGAGR